MATKRRRLKNKKKDNNTRKVGGGDPLELARVAKALEDIKETRGKPRTQKDDDDAADLAALLADAENIQPSQPKNDEITNKVEGESLDEIKGQFPKRDINPNRRKSPKMRPSLSILPDEDVYDFLNKADDETLSEQESEPKSIDIEEVTRKISLLVSKAADALETMKVSSEREIEKDKSIIRLDEEFEYKEPTDEELAKMATDAENKCLTQQIMRICHYYMWQQTMRLMPLEKYQSY